MKEYCFTNPTTRNDTLERVEIKINDSLDEISNK